MERNENISEELITKFLSGKSLSDNEVSILQEFIDTPTYHNELSEWLEKNWKESNPEPVFLKFEEIRKQLSTTHKEKKISQLLSVFSKIAAILFLPLLTISFYFYFNKFTTQELLTFSTAKGEQTHVVLPDKSEVWLNVDTKLSYPADYGINNRKLNLEGEALFKVAKNKKLPFKVTSGDITTEATGTQFVVSAYPESSFVKMSLIEGSVKVKINEEKEYKYLSPGLQLKKEKGETGSIIQSFDKKYELGWTNSELIFQLTPFDVVVKKLEKWYNIKIDYNPQQFKKETLTVTFKKYETLENVLKVVSKANGFKYSFEGKLVKITKKSN